MTDIILSKLKQFEDAIETLPARLTPDEFEQNPLLIIEGDGIFSTNKGKSLLNSFMGYVVGVDRINKKEFTPKQIEKILEIYGEFQTYFEVNIVVPRTHRAHNKNAKTEEQKQDLLTNAMMHAFGFSGDPDYQTNVYNSWLKTSQNLENYTSFSAIYDRLIETGTDFFLNDLSPGMVERIERFSHDEASSDTLPDDILERIQELKNTPSAFSQLPKQSRIKLFVPKTLSPKKP